MAMNIESLPKYPFTEKFLVLKTETKNKSAIRRQSETCKRLSQQQERHLSELAKFNRENKTLLTAKKKKSNDASNKKSAIEAPRRSATKIITKEKPSIGQEGRRESLRSPKTKKIRSVSESGAVKRAEHLRVSSQGTDHIKKSSKRTSQSSVRSSVSSNNVKSKPNPTNANSPASSSSGQHDYKGGQSGSGNNLLPKTTDLHGIKETTADDNLLSDIVKQTDRDRKIFSSFENRWYIREPIRDELTKRGWLEYVPDRAHILKTKLPSILTSAIQNFAIDRTTESLMKGTNFHVTSPSLSEHTTTENQSIMDFGNRGRTPPVAIRKRTFPAHKANMNVINEIIEECNLKISLLWLSGRPQNQLRYFPYVPSIGNKFQKSTFCTKLGLWENLRSGSHRVPLDIQFPIKYPRMYNLGDPVNEAHFIFEFNITAVVSLLRWFVKNGKNSTDCAIYDKESSVSIKIIEMAVRKGKMYCSFLKTGDDIKKEKLRTQPDWQEFLGSYYKVHNENQRIKSPGSFVVDYFQRNARVILQEILKFRPEMEHDGVSNIWIAKPYSAACGRGIFITNNIQYIEQLPEKKYIIQKYIERPYLIAKTKFDIRQWLLLTNLRPLEFWMYKECYLRFCTVPYETINLHESIHLSNNAIQRKYARNVGLPYQNMWDSTTFKSYLEKTNKGSIWEELIFPAMRDALTCALLSSQDTFDHPEREGWFELYGADFMLTSHLSDGPWLIEINNGPALDPSSPVTARMCNQMLRDIIKVVIDRRDGPCDTGDWIMAYRQPEPSTPPHST